MRNILKALFVIVLAHLLMVFPASAELLPPKVIVKKHEHVCLPLEDEDFGVFECVNKKGKWVFCAMDDDLELFCID